MGEFLEIGSIRLPISWIFIGLGLLSAYLVVNVRLKKTEWNRKQLVDSMFNALFYGFIVWKLSYILFNPMYAFTNPLGILYFSGGQKGIILAIAVGIFYIFFQSAKQKVRMNLYADLFLTGWFAGSAIFFIYLLTDNHYHYGGQLVLALFLLIVINKKSGEVGNVRSLLDIVLIYSLAQVFLQYFSKVSPYFLGLTIAQIVFALIAIVTLVFQFKSEATNGN